MVAEWANIPGRKTNRIRPLQWIMPCSHPLELLLGLDSAIGVMLYYMCSWVTYNTQQALRIMADQNSWPRPELGDEGVAMVWCDVFQRRSDTLNIHN